VSDLPNIPKKVEESSKGWPLWLALFDAGAFYVSIKSAGGGAGGRGVVGAYAGVSVADPPLPSVPLPFVSILGGPIFEADLILKPVSADRPPCGRARMPGACPQNARTIRLASSRRDRRAAGQHRVQYARSVSPRRAHGGGPPAGN